jgi:transcriptional regulator
MARRKNNRLFPRCSDKWREVENPVTDRNEILDFINRYSFVTMVTAKSNYPSATDIPFSVSTEGSDIVLTSHISKANDQWTDLETEIF